MPHNQFSVLCLVTIYKEDRERAQKGLLEEAVLKGGEGNSQDKECASQPERDKTLLGRNLVLCSEIYEKRA